LPAPDPARFDIPPQRLKAALTIAASVFGIVGFATANGPALLTTLGAALWAWLLPSREALARTELERRRQQLSAEFQAAVAANDRPRIERVPALQKELALEDSEVALEREGLDACFALYALEDAIIANGLPVIAGYEDVLKSASCHFAAEAHFEKRGPDETAMLLFSDREILFNGVTGQTRIPWSKVTRVTNEGRDLLVQRADRQTAYRFQMSSMKDALVGVRIASKFCEKSSPS
jgi:hypothetical protein